MARTSEPLHDFTVIRGDQLAIAIAWTDEDDAPVDVTGFDADLKIRDADGETLLELDADGGRIVLGDALGTIAVTLTGAETEALVAGEKAPTDLPVRVHYQLRVSDGGAPTTVAKGRICIAYSAIEG